METFTTWLQANQWLLIPFFIWDITWRLLAMWNSARQNQKIWFISLLIVNSVGILPLIYLLFFSKAKFWIKPTN